MKKSLAFLFALSIMFSAQNFSEYRMRYDSFGESDGRALPYVNSYIKKAKSDRNYPELFQAYKDAIYFAPNGKLAYADSAVAAAGLTGQKDLIATAYITKGTVLYFNYRRFQPALDEYLKAWKFTKETDNQYLHYKNLYHIGVIKSYLGYYAEAFEIFETCEKYYQEPQVQLEPPNLKYNRKKGYLNALHQKANCLIELNRMGEAGSLIEEGLKETIAQADFYFERSCFFKLQGIIAYRKGHEVEALSAFQTALPGFLRKNDFTNASLIYYYVGRSQASKGDDDRAVRSFAKVDSIFTQHAFLLPEVRPSYEKLIDYYHQIDNKEREHYYTLQLLKADHLLSTDFKYLSGKITKEYDTGDLLAAKKRLEHSVSRLYTVIWSIVMLLLFGTSILLYSKRRRVWLRSMISQNKKTAVTAGEENVPIKKSIENSQRVPEEVVQAVLKRLAVLEKNNFFLESGMTLHKLAPMVETNSTYLSIIIKEYRGCPYNHYIKEKRIHYAGQMLRENKMWRSMTIENLAKACGFRDRNNFSDAFYEFHDVKPLEYIQKIRKERSDNSA